MSSVSILAVFLYLFSNFTMVLNFCPSLAGNKIVCRFESNLYLYSDDVNGAYEYKPIGPSMADIKQYCHFVTIDGLNFNPINMSFEAPTDRLNEASSLYENFGALPLPVLFEFQLSSEQEMNKNSYNQLKNVIADDRRNDELIEQCVLVIQANKLEGMLIQAFMSIDENQIYLNFLTKLYKRFLEYKLYLFVRADWYPESIESGDLQFFADIQTRCHLLIIETNADHFISNYRMTIPVQFLQSSHCDSNIDKASVKFITETVLQNGVSADKLSITVTTHCQTYRVIEPQQNIVCIGAPISGYAAKTSIFTSGFSPFFDICVAQNTFWSKPEYTVSCTDLNLAAEIAFYALEKCLAAVTISYVNYDDGVNENCRCGFTLPITTVVSNVLHGDKPTNYKNCLKSEKLNILQDSCCNEPNDTPQPISIAGSPA